MGLAWLAAYAHVVATVVLVGYMLYWVVMTTAIRSERTGESARMLDLVRGGRWPPVGVPRNLRLPFPALGWVFLLALLLTGVLMLISADRTWDAWLAGPSGRLLLGKLALFALLVGGHLAVMLRPRWWLAFLNGTLTMLIVIVSALLRH